MSVVGGRQRASRRPPKEREDEILAKAIEHFAADGFDASTHDLAKKLGVSQSLVYRYFPTKEVLANKVFDKVFLSRWNPKWETLLADRSIPIERRLKFYYAEYTLAVLSDDWIRIMIFAGLKQAGINEKLFELLREKVYIPVVSELRREFKLPEPVTAAEVELDIELVWALHASITYLSIRKSVYRTPIPNEINVLVENLVEGFIGSIKNVGHKRRAAASLIDRLPTDQVVLPSTVSTDRD